MFGKLSDTGMKIELKIAMIRINKSHQNLILSLDLIVKPNLLLNV